jgi:hypothetical protein
MKYAFCGRESFYNMHDAKLLCEARTEHNRTLRKSKLT